MFRLDFCEAAGFWGLVARRGYLRVVVCRRRRIVFTVVGDFAAVPAELEVAGRAHSDRVVEVLRWEWRLVFGAVSAKDFPAVPVITKYKIHSTFESTYCIESSKICYV